MSDQAHCFVVKNLVGASLDADLVCQRQVADFKDSLDAAFTCHRIVQNSLVAALIRNRF